MLHFSSWKAFFIVFFSVLSLLFSLPNFFSSSQLSWLPGFIPQWKLTLGLDLQGGSHLLLEVDESEVIEVRLSKLRDDIRAAFRAEKIGYSSFQISGESLVFRIRDTGQIDLAKDALHSIEGKVTSSLVAGAIASEIIIEHQDNGAFVVSLSQEGRDRLILSAVDRSMEVIRRRIDQVGTVDPTIQRQGRSRIVVQVPGLHDPDRLKILLGSTARLAFRLVDNSVSPSQGMDGQLPVGSELVEGLGEPPQLYVLEKREIVSGENLIDARPGFSPVNNEPVVSFRFDSQGAKKFGIVTRENVGVPFAIVLDGQVISAPVIREPILGGVGQISGNFSIEEARDLAILLRAGALPAKLAIVEERTVGAGLGADQIRSGVIAVLVGLSAVLLFMLLSYGTFGIFSNIALLVNISMIISILSALGATLTLPGISGIVLTVGMAVDANVLIFERIREDLDAGKSLISSIDGGFSRALSAILDANITTLIAAVVLFYLGAGPVRGFAVTLAVGVITSVFTAFTLSRFLIALWVRWHRPKTMPL